MPESALEARARPAVCDLAYEDLDDKPLHWPVPIPDRNENTGAFEGACDDSTGRITRLAASFEGEAP